MASIIQGYEYDIFISYHQKDNKNDGCVTEFVDNQKGELESTFKEEINVYFGINPHVRLLENHETDTFGAQSKTNFINPKEITLIDAFAVNKEQAMDMLDRAYKVHESNLIGPFLPGYDTLRNEPRFQALCREMNLPIR